MVQPAASVDTLPSQLSVLVTGSSGVGKSALINTFRHGCSKLTSAYSPTIETSHTSQYILADEPADTHKYWSDLPSTEQKRQSGRRIILTLSEVGGSTPCWNLMKSAIESADAFMIVYDVGVSDALDHVWKTIKLIAETKLTKPEDIPMMLVGNMIDTVAGPTIVSSSNQGASKRIRQITCQMGKEFSQLMSMPFAETTCKAPQSVAYCFRSLILHTRKFSNFIMQKRMALESLQNTPKQLPVAGPQTSTTLPKNQNSNSTTKRDSNHTQEYKCLSETINLNRSSSTSLGLRCHSYTSSKISSNCTRSVVTTPSEAPKPRENSLLAKRDTFYNQISDETDNLGTNILFDQLMIQPPLRSRRSISEITKSPELTSRQIQTLQRIPARRTTSDISLHRRSQSDGMAARIRVLERENRQGITPLSIPIFSQTHETRLDSAVEMRRSSKRSSAKLDNLIVELERLSSEGSSLTEMSPEVDGGPSEDFKRVSAISILSKSDIHREKSPGGQRGSERRSNRFTLDVSGLPQPVSLPRPPGALM